MLYIIQLLFRDNWISTIRFRALRHEDRGTRHTRPSGPSKSGRHRS